MKYLKMLALAAMACTALMAFASTASATMLTAPAGTAVKTGTEIKSSLKSKTSATLSDSFGVIQNTCTSSTVNGKTTNETGETITGNIETLDFASCTRPTETIANGKLHIKWTTGNNGTVSGSESQVRTEVPGGSHCIYGTASGTTLGTFTGATSSTGNATLDINAELPLIKAEGTCPSTAKWVAEYTVTSPLGLVAME